MDQPKTLPQVSPSTQPNIKPKPIPPPKPILKAPPPKVTVLIILKMNKYFKEIYDLML